ncbi:MAG TPA: alternative ribosome rescue aminoacyl-tRNA hydrolase ArfB [Gemmatimonadaceae bacterium]
MSDDLKVTESLSIPRAELEHRASRSGGAGGQHVNTSSTRIELLWDFASSRDLSEEEKDRLRHRLARRIDADGRLRVVADNRRSQLQNRIEAEIRLATLVRDALHVAKKRRATRPTKASKEKRLSNKKKRSETKSRRRDKDFG